MPSATSKGNPDLNWHIQYEKLLFHITRGTDADQTSGSVNFVAQKNNQGPNFFLCLYPDTLTVTQPVTRCRQFFLGSNPIITASEEKDQLFLLQLYLCCVVMFSYKSPSRLLLCFQWESWPNFKARNESICHFIKAFLDHLLKYLFAKAVFWHSIHLHQTCVFLLSFYH